MIANQVTTNETTKYKLSPLTPLDCEVKTIGKKTLELTISDHGMNTVKYVAKKGCHDQQIFNCAEDLIFFPVEEAEYGLRGPASQKLADNILKNVFKQAKDQTDTTTTVAFKEEQIVIALEKSRAEKTDKETNKVK